MLPDNFTHLTFGFNFDQPIDDILPVDLNIYFLVIDLN